MILKAIQARQMTARAKQNARKKLPRKENWELWQQLAQQSISYEEESSIIHFTSFQLQERKASLY